MVLIHYCGYDLVDTNRSHLALAISGGHKLLIYCCGYHLGDTCRSYVAAAMIGGNTSSHHTSGGRKILGLVVGPYRWKD